jgi:hypothetical protein
MVNNATLINQDSGNTEWYTPPEIIEAARKTMGSIDFDPFSSSQANTTVKAKMYCTKEQNGLLLDWFGNIWMNHPFNRDMNKQCVAKLDEQYEAGNVTQACCITFAATSEVWFMPLLARPQCFLYGRTNYYLPDGTKKTGVTKGSVVTYFGMDAHSFWLNFKDLGEVKVPMNYYSERGE